MRTKNIKPFDLQAALKGEPVMLRNGQKAFVRHHETEQPTGSCWELWGIGNRKDGSTMFLQWSTGGRYDMDYAVSDLDIIGMYQKTHIVNGFEVPAPETEEPDDYTKYYAPNLFVDEMHSGLIWHRNSEWDNRLIRRGLLFLNKEDAIANTKAMLGINPYGED